MTSMAAHGIFVFMAWVLWVAAAAAITQSVGGNLNCKTQHEFVYCGHLNALEAFAWMIWIILTFLLVAIIVRGVIVVRRAEGYGGGLVDEWLSMTSCSWWSQSKMACRRITTIINVLVTHRHRILEWYQTARLFNHKIVLCQYTTQNSSLSVHNT